MIYITGDLHGDSRRFQTKELRRLKKTDTLIVCGDFGFVWDGSPGEQKQLKWIGKRRYQVLFVEGPHDNLELLEQYPLEEWNGGKTRHICGNLRQLCRGEVFRLEGKDIFAFGGGEAEDDRPMLQPDWAGGELPHPEEIANAWNNLARVQYKVDYIITHQPSRKIRQFLDTDRHDANALDAFLDEVRDRCSYRRWYFGALHKNKLVPPGEMALFTSVVPAE